MAEVRSQNGWSAPGRSVIATYTVPGTTLRIPLRTGDVSVVLLEYLARYHREVESLYNQPQDLWGYADRNVRGSATTVSNHASGTAVDARAVKNGLGMRGTFTAAQGHALDRLLAYFEGVIRHGRTYSRPDPMHAEVNSGAAAVKRIADKIRAGVSPSTPLAPGVAVTTPIQFWSHPVPDYYTANNTDTMWASECLAWGTTHAAHARDAARQALAKTTTLESKVDALLARGLPTTLSDADVQRIAKAVIAGIGGTPPSGLAQVYEFTGTATPKDPA